MNWRRYRPMTWGSFCQILPWMITCPTSNSTLMLSYKRVTHQNNCLPHPVKHSRPRLLPHPNRVHPSVKGHPVPHLTIHHPKNSEYQVLYLDPVDSKIQKCKECRALCLDPVDYKIQQCRDCLALYLDPADYNICQIR